MKLDIIICVIKFNKRRKLMKNLSKNLLLFLLVFVLAGTTVSPIIASAARTGRVQTVVMYVGEAYESTDFTQVKSIKNTNQSVVKTSKDKKIIRRLFLKPKKQEKLR